MGIRIMIENDLEMTDEIHFKTNNFLKVYTNFKNESSDNLDLNEEEKVLFDKFRKYKLASSEGVNKLANRMIRFNTLKELIIVSDTLDDDVLVNDLVEKVRTKSK